MSKYVSINLKTFSSGAPEYKCLKVSVMFFVNLCAKTSLSAPNWCLDCRTIESITYNPDTLNSGRHCKKINQQHAPGKKWTTGKPLLLTLFYNSCLQMFSQTFSNTKSASGTNWKYTAWKCRLNLLHLTCSNSGPLNTKNAAWIMSIVPMTARFQALKELNDSQQVYQYNSNICNLIQVTVTKVKKMFCIPLTFH